MGAAHKKIQSGDWIIDHVRFVTSFFCERHSNNTDPLSFCFCWMSRYESFRISYRISTYGPGCFAAPADRVHQKFQYAGIL